MTPNPVLEKLGFSPEERIIIIQADDIGMCEASVSAFRELWTFGLISSGTVMVPCPWFLQAATFFRGNPQVDVGIHLTFTSEWETYRWGPISTADPSSGMMDSDGCFYRTAQEAKKHGDADAVTRELRAQVERAVAMGIIPTHIDTHMRTVEHPKFLSGYLQLAIDYALPIMMMHKDEQGWLEFGMDAEMAKLAAFAVAQAEERGIPLVDHAGGMGFHQGTSVNERIAYAKNAIDTLQPGITHFYLHPSKDTPELRAITPDWPYRVADYLVFKSEELRDYIRQSNVQVIGYGTLKGLVPS